MPLGFGTESSGTANRRRTCNRSGRCDGRLEDSSLNNKLAPTVALKEKVWVVCHGRVYQELVIVYRALLQEKFFCTAILLLYIKA